MKTAVALGSFDGVHIAHAALIRNAVSYARTHDLLAMAYVFEPHPRLLLRPEKPVELLTTFTEKEALLYRLGIDKVQAERRGEKILQLSPEAFVKEVLAEELQASFVTAGENYRFGKKAAGDALYLKKLCEKAHVRCEIMDTVFFDGQSVSSTRIRQCLSDGEIEMVNRLSFAPYTKCGTVIRGKKLGRKLGFPTLNIAFENGILLPKKGVYISRTTVDGESYCSITNVGENPTVETAKTRMESHLFGYDAEAYGKSVAVTLLSYLRPEIKFASVDALMAQLVQDKEAAIQYFKGERTV